MKNIREHFLNLPAERKNGIAETWAAICKSAVSVSWIVVFVRGLTHITQKFQTKYIKTLYNTELLSKTAEICMQLFWKSKNTV